MKRKKATINDDVIIKYLAGEASPEEALSLEEWLDLEENRQVFEEFRQVYLFTYPDEDSPGIDKDSAWDTIKKRTTLDAPKRVWFFQRTVPKIAAFMMLFLLSAVSLFYFFLGTGQEVMVMETQDNLQTFELPDGSMLSLHKFSIVSYEENFGDGHRKVTLEKGEGFFEVMPHDSEAFVVQTEQGEIEVLGTVFNAKLDPDVLEVVVAKGKVKLSSEEDATTLEGGQSGWSRAGKITVENQLNVNYFAYATGILVFEETPLREIVEIIEKTYGKSVKVSEASILNCHLTGTFDGISMENLVNLIAETLNLSVAENEEGYILEGNGC
ncbi:FecR family protein [Pleomorphovibrio marinus]|uniref:FecR family protein n=1 Tax=Pleomorphovibrio marinus TaxID=2164132 RepID=UPI000E0ACB9D|nr:FecR domain-containing protein [Pleomorphovibrio marinus]